MIGRPPSVLLAADEARYFREQAEKLRALVSDAASVDQAAFTTLLEVAASFADTCARLTEENANLGFDNWWLRQSPRVRKRGILAAPRPSGRPRTRSNAWLVSLAEEIDKIRELASAAGKQFTIRAILLRTRVDPSLPKEKKNQALKTLCNLYAEGKKLRSRKVDE